MSLEEATSFGKISNDRGMSAAAREAGVSLWTIKNRLDKGMSLEEARAFTEKKGILLWGHRTTKAALAEACGVRTSTLSRWHTAGLTPEQIIAKYRPK